VHWHLDLSVLYLVVVVWFLLCNIGSGWLVHVVFFLQWLFGSCCAMSSSGLFVLAVLYLEVVG
jgi:hypothetical protein